MACENVRSESEWSLGRPAASPTCRGHHGEGAEDAQGAEGAQGMRGTWGVRWRGRRRAGKGGRGAEGAEGAEGTEGAEGRGVQGAQRLQRVQRLQWVRTHGAEGAEATEGAECSHRSSRSAAAVDRRWPPPPGGPTRPWPACGSYPWPWRTAQASARPLPGAGCKEGAEREQSACRAHAERAASACRALQSACRQPCALAKPISRPVFLRMAFSIASLFLKRSVDSLVITTILRPSACSRRSTACGCSRRGLATRGGSRGGAHLANGVSPSYGSSAPAGGMGARLLLRGLRERL